MDETESEQAEATTPVSRPHWKRWMGNIEVVIALLCICWLLFVPGEHGVLPSSKLHRFNSPWLREVPWLKFIIWGLGIGCSLGAMRFGNRFCRILGMLCLLVFLVLLFGL